MAHIPGEELSHTEWVADTAVTEIGWNSNYTDATRYCTTECWTFLCSV